jgi:hypothetical protein
VTASQHPEGGHGAYSVARAGHKNVFSAWSITGSFERRLDRRSMPPGHSADAMGSLADIAAACREMRPKYAKARPYLIAERSS